MDIKDIKNEVLRVQFEIADILQKLEEKTDISVVGVDTTCVRELGQLHCSINKIVRLNIDLN